MEPMRRRGFLRHGDTWSQCANTQSRCKRDVGRTRGVRQHAYERSRACKKVEDNNFGLLKMGNNILVSPYTI